MRDPDRIAASSSRPQRRRQIGARLAPSPARGGRLLAALLALACSVAAPARATDGERFERARAEYARGDYAIAVELFENMVGGPIPAIEDPILIRESRKYLGAAYVLTGRPELARQQFEWLLLEEGEAMDAYQLDPAAFPGEVLEVFAEVKRELIRRREAREEELRREAEARQAARREAQLELLALAQEDEVVVSHDPALAWVPFGVGQLQNGNRDLGAFFLATEAITLAGAIATFSAWMLVPDDSTSDRARLAGLQVGNWVSAGAFAVLALAGIIEANVSFVPSHTVRREREVPPELLERLELSIGPGSVGLRLRF